MVGMYNKMKGMKMKCRKIFVRMMAAAVCCAAVVGCVSNDGESDAAAAVGPTDADASTIEAAVPEKIVSIVTEWLKTYQAGIPFDVENEGKDVYIRGVVGRFPSHFSKYDIVINLSAGDGEAYCYGYLPTSVPDERRADVIEFLFRAECAYGLSPATFVLTDDGLVRCQAWCPFSELEKAPEKAMPKLAGSVMEKLFSCSRVIGQVLLNVAEPNIAEVVRPAGIFKHDPADNKADTATILKTCFADSEYVTSNSAGDWFVGRFGGGDDTVGFINAHLEGVKKDLGGLFDKLPYTLVVKDGTVCNICLLPIDIPDDRLAAVADAAMRLNQSLKSGLFCVDFENRKLWCRYSIPVSALTDDPGSKKTNFNLVAIKVMSAAGIARNSEAFSAMVKNAAE